MNERDRVLHVMQSEGMNAKQFCQEVGISQGTLSNILGGRNKPSLEVLQAILRRFRAISCDWLIMGVGSVYVAGGGREDASRTLFDANVGAEEVMVSVDAPSVQKQSAAPSNVLTEQSASALRTVQKVLIFYSDGTFEER